MQEVEVVQRVGNKYLSPSLTHALSLSHTHTHTPSSMREVEVVQGVVEGVGAVLLGVELLGCF